MGHEVRFVTVAPIAGLFHLLRILLQKCDTIGTRTAGGRHEAWRVPENG